MGTVRDVLRVRNRRRLPESHPDPGGPAEWRRRTVSYLTQARNAVVHREVVDRLAAEQCRVLSRRGAADLSVLSARLAAAAAAEMAGLTGRAGVEERLDRCFRASGPHARGLGARRRKVSEDLGVLAFLWRDVRPAIADRRRVRRDDLISHLIDEGCTRAGDLEACVTFAVAGMVAVREFVTVAAWHLLTDDGLRARYTEGDEARRTEVLLEILDQEPVIAGPLRWTSADPGHRADGDHHSRVAGHRGGRGGEQGQVEDAGVRIAVQETDVFLGRLFAMPGLRLLREPTVIIRPGRAAYELRGLILAV